MSKVMHVFFEVSMSNGHPGLHGILKKSRKTIQGSETALFINKDWTACKLLTAHDTLLHLRRPRNAPINPETLKYLPHCIDGDDLNYEAALRTVIKEKYDALYED